MLQAAKPSFKTVTDPIESMNDKGLIAFESSPPPYFSEDSVGSGLSDLSRRLSVLSLPLSLAFDGVLNSLPSPFICYPCSIEEDMNIVKRQHLLLSFYFTLLSFLFPLHSIAEFQKSITSVIDRIARFCVPLDYLLQQPDLRIRLHQFKSFLDAEIDIPDETRKGDDGDDDEEEEEDGEEDEDESKLIDFELSLLLKQTQRFERVAF